ncbi:MAG: DUF5702 domain-containing protein [Lachnospiraceae bacterium]|nr:DUF5702 domain-containing protein [Lachnospiraceae bacterium]
MDGFHLQTSSGRGRALTWTDGVITVFFTLLSAVMIGFLFALLESARMEGARAQAVCVSDMASFSVFGEFERKVLKDFDVFALDGSGGSGEFSIERVEDRLKHYLKLNAEPNQDGIASLCFDPWGLELTEGKVTKYALLTDQGGENFYQQVVGYMHETAWMDMTADLVSLYQKTDEISGKKEQIEQEQKTADQQMEEISKAEEEKKQELEAAGNPGDGEGQSDPSLQLPAPAEPAEKVENPLSTLRKLKNKDLLEIVCPGMEISENRVYSRELCSQRSKKKGNMAMKTPYGGLVDDLLFREYLLDRFDCFTQPGRSKLKYELEYILSGKNGDWRNLKNVLKNMLAFRECVNYLYLSGDDASSSQVGTLAEMLIGWLGMPGLTGLLKHGLLLGWAYGESLCDVKRLTAGGRVPLQKDASTWQLSLTDLAKLDTWLDNIGGGKSEDAGGSGLNYREHLRVLLYITPISQLKKRGLDMLELSIREDAKLSSFRADHCLVGMKTQISWQIPPHFSKVTWAYLRRKGGELSLQVSGGYAYGP